MNNTSTRSVRNALAMFLMLLRNNVKQEMIAHNFSTSQQVVSKTIDTVFSILEKEFVPKHLGYNHINREEAITKHSIYLTSKVLQQPESRICLIADCTYLLYRKTVRFRASKKNVFTA